MDFEDLNAPLETERLTLRPVRGDDLPALIELKSDPAVNRYLPYSEPPTPEQVALALEAELELAAAPSGTLLLGIQRHDASVLVGHVAIWPRETAGVPRGELIIMVAAPRWRRGIAAEACTAAIERWRSDLDGSMVYAAVHPEKLACQALMRKIGLDREVPGHAFPGIHSETDRVFFTPTRRGGEGRRGN